MARVNHKLVRQRLDEKRSSITDKQFFTSRLLAGHYEDEEVDKEHSYLSSWNAETGKVEMIYGEDPKLFGEDEDT